MRGFHSHSYTARGRDAREPAAGGKKAKSSSGSFLTLLPEVWVFVRPQRWLLLLGFLLMAINRLAGFVLPASMQPLYDKVIHNGQRGLLLPIVVAILAATIIQGVTSYALTQLLSKAAQRMIAELRTQVQAHIGRLTVAFHDANKSGALLTRIMTDVDGLRNLMGTGLVDFAGSLMTAVIAFVLLMRISVVLTSVVLVILLATGLSLNVAIGWIRPIYRARSKIFAEVTGRLAESLGGIRVVKGYRAEAREEEAIAAAPDGRSIRGRSEALARKCAADAHGNLADEPGLYDAAGYRERADYLHGRAASAQRECGGDRGSTFVRHVPEVRGIHGHAGLADFPDR